MGADGVGPQGLDGFGSRLGAVSSWLRRVRGRDAVERQQAYIFQAVLLFMTIAFLVATVANLMRESLGGAPANVLANLLFVALFGGLLVVLRRGHFRIAASAFVALLIFGFGASLDASGLTNGASYLALLIVPIVIAGLLLPRIALIATAIAVYATGYFVLQGDPALAERSVPSPLSNFLFATLFVAIAVDLFGGAVRQALRRAVAHEAELEAGREALASRTGQLQQAVRALEGEIAERTRLEEEREQLHARMVESERLESIGVLAGGIAHDFNNLLTAISGYAELAQDRLPARDAAQQAIVGISRAADQAAGLTRQLLAFAGASRSARRSST